jgi:hypothetical protein
MPTELRYGQGSVERTGRFERVATMTATYEKHGVEFLFPENWKLEEQEGEGQWSVAVQSPLTAFWSITVDETGRSPESLAADALAALREEYASLDVSEVNEPVGRWDAVGHDVAFFCLDLTNTGAIRAFRAGSRSVLLLFQANDAEWGQVKRVFRAMGESLRCSEP